MNTQIAAALVALMATAVVISVALSQTPSTPANPRADINGDGDFNSGDQGILAAEIISGRTVSPNPCVPLEYWDDAHPWPTERGVSVNSLGEPYTPRGWSYGVPGDHPGYAVLASGSPFPLVACP